MTAARTDVLHSIQSKILRVSGLPMIVTGRGLHQNLMHLSAYLCLRAQVGSVDKLLPEITAYLRSQNPWIRWVNYQQEFIFAGISESEGPKLWFAHYGNSAEVGFAPYELYECPEFLWPGGNLTRDEWAGMRILAGAFAHGVERAGVNVMQIMRHKPPRHLIGGRLEKAVVTEDGVVIETLGGWPDKIGQKIDSSAAPFEDASRHLVLT